MEGTSLEKLDLCRHIRRHRSNSKGSPHRRPRVNLPRSSDFSHSHPHRAAVEVARNPLSEELTKLRPKHDGVDHSRCGFRVCRRSHRRQVSKSRKRPVENEKRHSFKQVSNFLENALEHPYWGTLSPPEDSPSKARPADDPRKRIVVSPAEMPNNNESFSENHREKNRQKRFGISDPATWAAIHRALAQQRRLSSLTLSDQFDSEVLHSPSIPSRTSSQRKALRHFTRELEKYAKAAGAAGKLPVITPTESESKPSVHTIKPLLPYRTEFQAAGLAVTSEEQRGKLPAEARAKSSGLNLRKGSKRRNSLSLPAELDGQDDDRCTSSIYSGDTYIRFTPEDGVSTAMLELMREKEQSVQRRPLPWLRKTEAAGNPVSPVPNSASRTKVILNGKVHINIENLEKTTIPDSNQLSRQHLPTDHDVTRLPLIKKVSPTPPQDLQKYGDRHDSRLIPDKLERPDTQNKPAKGLGKRPPGLKREDALASIPRVGAEDDPSGKRMPKLHNSQTPAKEEHINLPFQAFRRLVAHPQKNSPAPELPRTWRHVVSTTSSLERALDAVSGNTGKRENEKHRLEPCSEQPNFAEHSTNRPRNRPAGRVLVSKRRQKHHPPLAIRNAESDRDPQAMAAQPSSKHSPVELAGQPPPKVTSPRKPNAPPPEDVQFQSRITPEPTKSAVEKALSDLDVFFNYDDSDIKDRDVLRGLQIAVHAAADEMFDAKIRQKTGLRIRRFLADLNSVNALDNDKITEEQPAREKRAEERRLT
ncbi:hypothetical protein PG994_012396, partial [Apiospora phragmitis]